MFKKAMTIIFVGVLCGAVLLAWVSDVRAAVFLLIVAAVVQWFWRLR